MERKLRFMFLATIAVLALLGSSAAQTSHTVGGSLGWIVPPAGESAYTSWARNQSFRVDDTLIFNFPTGAHTVAGVSRADFDACNINNPTFTIRNGPATVALNSTGSHYYICTIPGHCSGGQKLQINVSAATSSSPAPQPASPTPRAPSPAPQPASPAPRAPSPAPQPASPAPRAPSPAPQSAAQTSHTVGGSLGWIVPPAGESAYTSWARNQSFRVGDTLIFNFPTGAHTVAGVSRADFDACNINNPTFTIRNGPATVALNSTGSHYYICTIPGHCSGGQKLQINVSASASSSPAPQSASPAPPPAGSPGSSATPPSPSSSVPSAPSPPGPPGSSATSLGVAGVSATLFSLVVAMFFV